MHTYRQTDRQTILDQKLKSQHHGGFSPLGFVFWINVMGIGEGNGS